MRPGRLSPVLRLAWDRSAENRRLRRARLRDLALLTAANAQLRQATVLIDGWKARAEALYLIADPDKRDGVLAAVSDIEEVTR